MVPQVLMRLETLPLTPSGKTDYKNLPRPNLEVEPTRQAGQEPRTTAEKRIAGMWRDLIGVAEVGRGDRFFDLGGHSLLAMRFVLQVRKEFGVRLTLNSVLMESLEVIARQCSGESDAVADAQEALSRPVSLMDTFFFGNGQLYGVLRAPLSTPKTRRAVLICSPHGQESMRAQRLVTNLMTGLAEAGVASLRFDYFGTGDSEGFDREATLARWRQDIVEAYRELQQRTGADEIIPVGIRIGASLLGVLAREKRVKRCVLWDPIASGHLELQALRALHHDVLHDHGRFLWRLPPKATGDGEELASFHYSASLMAELATFSLQPADFAGLSSVQVLSSKQDPLLERFCQQLNVRGTRCELVAVNSDGDWSDFARLAHSLNRQEPIKKMLSTLLYQA
jgi:hypothetical protein